MKPPKAFPKCEAQDRSGRHLCRCVFCGDAAEQIREGLSAGVYGIRCQGCGAAVFFDGSFHNRWGLYDELSEILAKLWNEMSDATPRRINAASLRQISSPSFWTSDILGAIDESLRVFSTRHPSVRANTVQWNELRAALQRQILGTLTGRALYASDIASRVPSDVIIEAPEEDASISIRHLRKASRKESR